MTSGRQRSVLVRFYFLSIFPLCFVGSWRSSGRASMHNERRQGWLTKIIRREILFAIRYSCPTSRTMAFAFSIKLLFVCKGDTSNNILVGFSLCKRVLPDERPVTRMHLQLHPPSLLHFTRATAAHDSHTTVQILHFTLDLLLFVSFFIYSNPYLHM